MTKYMEGDAVVVLGGDKEPRGKVIAVRDQVRLPAAIGGGVEAQVNVRLEDGMVTGFIPTTLVMPIGRPKCVRCGSYVDIRGQCQTCMDKRSKVEQTHDPVQGLPNDDDDGVDDADLGFEEGQEVRLEGMGALDGTRRVASARVGVRGAEVYLESAPKTPETVDQVARNLTVLADRLGVPEGVHAMSATIGRAARKSLITSAIMLKGCADMWRGDRRYAREKMDRQQAIVDHMARERTEEAIKAPPPKYKLLFFGPSNPGTELAKDMEGAGVLPERVMDRTINELADQGWQVVFQHFDPGFIMEQWRVLLKKG